MLNERRGEPFRRIDIDAEETHSIIHDIHFRPKPIFSMTFLRNPQLIES